MRDIIRRMIRTTIDRLYMVTRVLPGVGRARPPVNPTPPSWSEPEPSPVPGPQQVDARDQQHVDATYDREHGHPKR